MAAVPPIKAIRRFCMQCQGGVSSRVAECRDEDCPLHPFRSGEEPGVAVRSCCQAVRCFCLLCSDAQRAEVRSCAAREDCALWSYRFGCTPTTWRRVKNRKTQPQPILLPGLE